MRLIRRNDQGKIAISNFVPSAIPQYAILSHTWGAEKDEVTLKDIVEDTFQYKKGRAKLDFCVDQAKHHGLSYLWIDTCCIDKTNSVELTESIISMFKWYGSSDRCYVFLEDVSYNKRDSQGRRDSWRSAFRSARWFRRGWTLQELLAPKCIEFYSREGTYLGDRTSLEAEIHAITQINTRALRGAPLSTFSLEERMSWARNRSTTKKEDEAYSLCGLFEVSMSAHYGEGDEAFVRLKEEIAKDQGRRIMSMVPPMRTLPTSASNQPQRTTYAPALVSVANDERSDRLLSLQFDQMETRRSTIPDPDPSTCTWFLNHPAYLQWIGNGSSTGHSRLLWIAGKPGTGKSTLMKSIYIHTRDTGSDTDIVVSSFFHARGEELEHSTEGMYRSLLWQLLNRSPDLQPVLDEVSDYAWTIKSLCKLLLSAISRLGPRRLVCFIDGVDESPEDKARDMILFFEQVVACARRMGTRVRLCFSSRHYPTVDIRHAEQVILENQPGHYDDILAYINTHLRGGQGHQVEAIKSALREKSGGIFLWVVLVVKILNERLTRGYVTQAMEVLDSLPPDLGKCFGETIRRDDIHLPDLLLSLQIIISAERPLNREEYYHAIVASRGHGAGAAAFDRDQITDDHLKWFISSTTKGLAYLTHSVKPTVRFIHESVHEYLVRDGGLAELSPIPHGDTPVHCHSRMKECCVKYIKTASHRLGLPDQLPKAKSDAGKALRQTAIREFPFLGYATTFIWQHAQKAISDATPQFEFLLSFPWQDWVRLTNVLQVHDTRRILPKSSPLYILVDCDAPKLISELPLSTSTGNDRTQPHPAFHALAKGHLACMWALLRREQTMQPAQGQPEVVHNAFSISRAQDKRGCSVLHRACDLDDTNLIRELLDLGCNIDQVGHDGRAPLHHAFKAECKPVVQLLLDKGANIELDDGDGRTALLWACRCGWVDIVEQLLDRDALIARPDKDGWTAVLWAARLGWDDIIERLVGLGAEIDWRDHEGCTALHLASMKGHASTARLLLRHGIAASVAAERNGATALIWAAHKGFLDVVQVLLEAGADAHLADKNGYNALIWAADGGHLQVVEQLLRGGAQIDAPDPGGRTALHWASLRGHVNVIGVLLRAGASTGLNDNERCRPLHLASFNGHRRSVALLLEWGADPGALDNLKRTARQQALLRGHREVVKLLTAG